MTYVDSDWPRSPGHDGCHLFPGCRARRRTLQRTQATPKPRPEASCQNVTPQSYPSPDKTLIATILPVDISLYATPDMESRVVIRNAAGDTLTSKDYSSPRGINGYYVYRAQWSPERSSSCSA